MQFSRRQFFDFLVAGTTRSMGRNSLPSPPLDQSLTLVGKKSQNESQKGVIIFSLKLASSVFFWSYIFLFLSFFKFKTCGGKTWSIPCCFLLPELWLEYTLLVMPSTRGVRMLWVICQLWPVAHPIAQCVWTYFTSVFLGWKDVQAHDVQAQQVITYWTNRKWVHCDDPRELGPSCASSHQPIQNNHDTSYCIHLLLLPRYN